MQAVYEQLASDLRHQGHTVVESWSEPKAEGAPKEEGAPDEEIYPLAFPSTKGGIPVPRTVAAAGRSLLRLGAGLYRCRPQIVNVHFVRAEAAHFLLLKRLLGYKVVLSVHGSDVLLPSQQNAKMLPHLLGDADAIVAVTKTVAERVMEYPDVDPRKVQVIPNKIDYDFWAAPAPEPDLARRPPTIVSVGRLTPVKGHDLLLKALAQVRENVPEARTGCSSTMWSARRMTCWGWSRRKKWRSGRL